VLIKHNHILKDRVTLIHQQFDIVAIVDTPIVTQACYGAAIAHSHCNLGAFVAWHSPQMHVTNRFAIVCMDSCQKPLPLWLVLGIINLKDARVQLTYHLRRQDIGDAANDYRR